jgi:hypothetical protein
MAEINGRISSDDIHIEKYLGPYGEETKNDNGERLIDLCIANDLAITNSKFKHKDMHKFTRIALSKNENFIIYYFVIKKENFRTIKDVKVTGGVEIGNRK